MPLEASEKIEALKQYYGVTHQGKLVVRGVGIRRHNTSSYGSFKTELPSALFDCENAGEVMNKGYDLVISKLFGQDITRYRDLFPHVSAAIQLSNKYKHPSKGDTIKFIYRLTAQKPYCKVASIDTINETE